MQLDLGDQATVVELEGAGHLLEPPYIPFTPYVFHKLVGECEICSLRMPGDFVASGGTPHMHAAASVQMWDLIRGHLTKRLPAKPQQMRPFAQAFDEMRAKL